MHGRVKSACKYSALFLGGVIAGAFLLESLEMYDRPIYRDTVIRSHLRSEQELLASRAAKANRPTEAAFHRWAVVNAESEKGFAFLTARGEDLDGKAYTLPFALPVLKWMASDEKMKKGARIVEGLDRGKLAAALEEIGRKEEAEEQWRLAQELMRRPTIEATKATVQRVLKLERVPVHKQAEDAILAPETK